MINFFTIQALVIQLIISVFISGIFFIKNKQIDNIKAGLMFSTLIFFTNIYSNLFVTIILGFFISIYLFKNYSNNLAVFIGTISSISIINSTYSNLWYLLLSNIIILTIYFLLYSKIIFKNKSLQQTITIDLLEWQSLKNTNTLNDKLNSYIPGILKDVNTSTIDTIREEVKLIIKYEK